MTIDPRWAMFTTFLIACWNFFTGYSGLNELGIDPVALKHFIAWGDLFIGFVGIGAGILAGIPSKDNKTGFIIKGPTPPEQPK